MNYDFVVLDPSGNITILVKTPVPAGERASVAKELMEAVSNAEQVGFLTDVPDGDIGLVMAGGEFCGNATMSAAVLFAEQRGREDARVLVRSSGAPGPVAVDVARQKDGSYEGTLAMPAPLTIRPEALPGGWTLPVVQFEGISHVILEEDLPAEAAEALARSWCRFLAVDALGILFLDRAASRMTPLVWVPSAGSLVWENACGSGTAAVGAFLSTEEDEPVTLTLRQPGGDLTISAVPDGPLWLTGTVKRIS